MLQELQNRTFNFAPDVVSQWSPTETLYQPETLALIKDNFVAELHAAYQAYVNKTENRTSLPFYVDKFKLPDQPLVQDGELFEVLVLGGTDGTRALCEKSDHGIAIKEQIGPLPLPKMGNLDQFHQFLNTAIDPRVRVVAINFANSLHLTSESGKIDGIIPNYDDTRALSAPELINKALGSEIEKHMASKRKTQMIVSVAGDGFCQLLSARTKYAGDNIAFGIVGTGYNMGFLIDNETFVNLDAASYSNFPMSDLARELGDAYGWHFGKEVNGTHLYKHFNRFLDQAKLDFIRVSSTRELSELAEKGIPFFSQLAQVYIDRAAQLVACQAAGIAEFKNSDMIFVMDGSVFWKAHCFKAKVDETAQLLTNKKVEFIYIPDSNIIGAAKLVA